MEFELKRTSRVCHGSHGKIGIVELGLKLGLERSYTSTSLFRDGSPNFDISVVVAGSRSMQSVALSIEFQCGAHKNCRFERCSCWATKIIDAQTT